MPETRFMHRTAKAQAKEELLTAAKVAEQLGASPAQVKKAIAAAGVVPDAKKGACAYYGPQTVKRIQKALK
ncbi:MAG: hypothetical protein KIT09_17540 [Bryobacteraceae bacterium]|nr:hypothetical protein [Bryobacteraceae bacterium]